MTIRFDAELGRALLPADQLDALVSGAARADWNGPDLAALHASGMVTADGPHASIAAAISIMAAPLCRLRLAEWAPTSEKPTCTAEAWLGAPTTALRIRRDANDEFAAIRSAYLPDELADLISLHPRARPSQRPFEVSAVWFGDLLGAPPALLAAAAERSTASVEGSEVREAVESVSTRLRRWWTVLVRWRPEEPAAPPQRLAILDTEDGSWVALPDDDLVTVLPASSGDVWRVLTQLMFEPQPPRAA